MQTNKANAKGNAEPANQVESAETKQIVVFKQGEEHYALSIDQIKEVVLTPSMTKLPQTPDFVRGVANIRGNIIAILDLERKFQLVTDQDPNRHKKFTLVIASEDYKIGLLVENVPNTMAINTSEIDDAVNIIQDGSVDQSYISGIIKKEDQLIILIDILKILGESEAQLVGQLNN